MLYAVKNGSKIIRLKRPETTIGRNRNNHVILAKSLKISRFHAVIRFFEDIPFIKDVSVNVDVGTNELSEWGVYLNGIPLPKKRWVEIAIGDNITFGAASVQDGGLIIEIVDLEPLQSEGDVNEVNNVSAQATVPSGSNAHCEMQTIDMTLDVCDTENVGGENHTSPQPASIPAPKSENTICISDEDDDEIIFIFPTPAPVSDAETKSEAVSSTHASVIHDENISEILSLAQASISQAENIFEVIDDVESAPKLTESIPQPLDVTSTMNGLLRPSAVKISPPSSPGVPTISSTDDIENKLAEMNGQNTPLALSPTPNEVDVKPFVEQKLNFINSQDLYNVLNYSNPDEIISLDSDEEDFPSSQLDCSQMAEVPDFSSAFDMMYELKSEIPSDDEEDVKFICQESWFGPLSQTVENVKSELTKGWRKGDGDASHVPMDIDEPLLNELEDALPDEIDHTVTTPDAVTEPVSSPSSSVAPEVSPKAHLKKKEPLRKVAVIAPLPQRRHKRRSIDTDDQHRKKIKEGQDSFKSPSKKHKTSSRYSSSYTKKRMSEKREKLKALYPEPPPEVEKQPKEHTSKAQPKVKVTSRNRGDFLTKLDTAPSTSASTSASSSPKPALPNKTKIEPEPLKVTKSKSGSSGVTKELVNDIRKLKIPRIAHPDNKIPSAADVNNLAKTPQVSPPVNDENRLNSLKTSPPKFPISTSKPAGKSILKVKLPDAKFTCDSNSRSGQKKNVRFPDRIITGCKEIEVEYTKNEISSYKTYEKLISECKVEFEQALFVILKWNVTWLQEQQKHIEPPPVYSFANCKIADFVDKYKQELKQSMFRLIWKNIFKTWNVPNNDNFPQTQDPGSEQISNFYTIEIDKVEISQKDLSNLLMTIHAKREVLFFEGSDFTIDSGKIAILNFRYTRPPSEVPQKTRVFAYIYSYSRFHQNDRIFDRIILKISAKPFQIVWGEAKMKVLNYYARRNLKPFQVLGMSKSCPVIQPLCDVNFHDQLNSMKGEDKPKLKNKNNRLLDVAQKKAVLTSLNCLTKDSSVSFVDGSSGTGKTQVIVGLIHELSNSNDIGKILIVTINDKLADDLVYRMCKDEFPKNVLKFGYCGNINQNVKHCSFDYKIQALMNNEGKDLVDVEDEIKIVNSHLMKLRNQIQCRSTSNKKEDLELKIQQCEKEIQELRTENSKTITQLKQQIARSKVIESSDIVVVPYQTCWTSNFENAFVPNSANVGDFTQIKICIFDDANFLDENAMLVPQMLQVQHLILVGDRKVIAYQNSPYNKILHLFHSNNKDFVTCLDVNYRASPEVSEWVRDFFKLNSVVKIPLRPRKINVKPFLVIDHASSQLVNCQAVLCNKLAKCIVEMDIGRCSVGVLVSKISDKDYLRSLFTANNFHNRIIVDFFNEFSTREMDIVIVCLPSSKISEQWLYIALTRAKSALIICGDFGAIEPVPAITSLLNFSQAKHIFYSLRGEDNDQILSEKLKTILSC